MLRLSSINAVTARVFGFQLGSTTSLKVSPKALAALEAYEALNGKFGIALTVSLLEPMDENNHLGDFDQPSYLLSKVKATLEVSKKGFVNSQKSVIDSNSDVLYSRSSLDSYLGLQVNRKSVGGSVKVSAPSSMGSASDVLKVTVRSTIAGEVIYSPVPMLQVNKKTAMKIAPTNVYTFM